MFNLMSILGKLRAGLGAMGLRPAAPEGEESVEQFVRRNLGDEVFFRLIEPFCAGVYAGDPTKLSMKRTLPKGAMTIVPSVCSSMRRELQLLTR